MCALLIAKLTQHGLKAQILLGKGYFFFIRFTDAAQSPSRDQTQDTGGLERQKVKAGVCWPCTEPSLLCTCQRRISRPLLQTTQVHLESTEQGQSYPSLFPFYSHGFSFKAVMEMQQFFTGHYMFLCKRMACFHTEAVCSGIPFRRSELYTFTYIKGPILVLGYPAFSCFCMPSNCHS